MFTSIHSKTGERVVVLDARWRRDTHLLRSLCATNHLVCEVCGQAVWARVGRRRRPHFAHKRLSDCPSSNESSDLLHARAALYHWLASKFDPRTVRVEVMIGNDGSAVPRHFDCIAETKTGVKLAYWIFDRQSRPDARDAIRSAAESDGRILVPVFTTTMMRRNNSPKGVLNLGTTERAFISRGEYDDLYTHGYLLEGSLHYLDGESETLTTLRAMSCTEPPQQYTGTEITTPLALVTVHAPTGQFVHPTEFDRLKAHRQRRAEEQRREAEHRAHEARRQHEREERKARELAERQKVWDAIGIRKDTLPCRMRLEKEAQAREASKPAQTAPPMQQLSIFDGREAPCETCGQMTAERDWVVYRAKTGQCCCRKCMSAGTPERLPPG